MEESAPLAKPVLGVIREKEGRLSELNGRGPGPS